MRERILALLSLLLLGGCSVAMSANRQSFKCDPPVIQAGADRLVIEKTCGPPDLKTDLDNGKVKAIYKIDPNAVTSGTKTAETAGNVAADVLTLGLWEIVATPIEIGSADKITTYIVVYGSDGRISTVEIVK